MSEYQDLKNIEMRRQNFVRKYGPHEEFVSDMGGLISEVAMLRDKADTEGYLDDTAKEILASFRHMVTRSADHGFKGNGCGICDRTRAMIEKIRKGDL